MTNTEFIAKVEELLPDINRLVMEKALKLARSDDMDLNEFSNDYRLPKMFIHCVTDDIARQYEAPYTHGNEKKIYKQIKRII